jgi:16S rRNA processing protein RimM
MTLPAADWVLLAHIVRPQGRHGEVLADIHTDFPDRFAQRKRVYLRGQNSVQEIQLVSHWLHKGRVVLKFAGVDTITDAHKLRGLDVVIPLDERVPLEGDAVYVSDLLGAKVIDVRGGGAVHAGEIIDVEPEGSGPAMLVIRDPSGEELLIPFVRAYLRRIDLEAKLLEMDLPAGLLAAQTASDGELE